MYFSPIQSLLLWWPSTAPLRAVPARPWPWSARAAPPTLPPSCCGRWPTGPWPQTSGRRSNPVLTADGWPGRRWRWRWTGRRRRTGGGRGSGAQRSTRSWGRGRRRKRPYRSYVSWIISYSGEFSNKEMLEVIPNFFLFKNILLAQKIILSGGFLV